MKKLSYICLTTFIALNSCITPAINEFTPPSSYTGGFIELDREYSSFGTKAISDNYVRRKIKKLISDAKGDKVIREILYHKFKNNNLIQTSINNEPALYTSIINLSEVSTRMAADSSFKTYIDSLAPFYDYSGTVPAPTGINNVSLQAGGSFSLTSYSDGGSRITLRTNSSVARYIVLEGESEPKTEVLNGTFSAGNISLTMTYRIKMQIRNPTGDLSISPIPNSIDKSISMFSTYYCGFNCYDMYITGSWTATGPTQTTSGTIASSITGFGIGFDTMTNINLDDYPNSTTLKNFRWGGNSGGVGISPALVNTVVDGEPITLTAGYVTYDLRLGNGFTIPMTKTN